MSRPTAISPEEQEQIARRIGVLLLQAAPEDWQQITVEYRATGEYRDLLGEVAVQDGGAEPWDPPEELWEVFEHLRDGMYRPEVGTWLSALYVVERPSSYRIDINFDAEPQWSQPLPPAAYADELSRYPRTEDNVPDWMRAKLEGPASPAADAPQAPAEQPEHAATAPQPAAAQVTAPQPPAFAGPAPAARFRTALVFDEFDEQGRPVVAARAPIPQEEVGPLRHYLENAPVVLASRDNDDDLLDPNAPAAVPSAWHTDGVWVWPGAVPYYLVQYGVPPQRELVEHIRARRFALGEVDDATRDAAVRELYEQPEHEDAEAAGFQQPAGFGPEQGLQAPADPGMQAEQRFAEEPRFQPEQEAGFAQAPGFQQAPGFEEAGAEDSGAEPGRAAEEAEEEFAVRLPSPERSRPEPHRDLPAGAEPPLLTHTAEQPAAEPAEPLPARGAEEQGGSRHGLDSGAADEDLDDTQAVLARLHDRLTELGVNSADYRIGSHSAAARCLLRDGPGWVVTAGEDDLHGDVRFEHADQAAAFLLGSLLLSSTEPLPAAGGRRSAGHGAAEAEPAPPAADAPAPGSRHAEDAEGGFSAEAEPEGGRHDADGGVPDMTTELARADDAAEPQHAEAQRPEPQRPEPQQPERSAVAEAEPEQSAAAPEPGSFEPFAPAKEPAADAESSIGALPRRTPEKPPEPPRERPAASPGGNFLFTANQDPVEPEPAPEGEATRFQPMPAPGPQPGTNGFAPPQQGPGGGLPQRTPRSAPEQEQQRPPAAGPAPQGQAPAAGRGGQAGPGMAGPPRQGPQGEPPQTRPGGPIKRPPQQGAPAQGGQAQQPQQGGQAQPNGQIQPLRGEPPLTLYRDRRQLVLQPGTELDRFGEPSGNVTYAAHTPYNLRSLPPQWSARPYAAYRVQRPVTALRGTAVPWFEQPGGGTAYVLPSAISDLLADGTLVELPEAQRPPME